MLNFLENHDEVRFASKAYAGDPLRVVPSLVVSSMISKGPFMIYYGQELGEPAADNEGFAGDNDRTTIFDYWSLATLRRWYGRGKVDGTSLTPQEKWLRGFYSRCLHLCNSCAPVREGDFFDLMYVNLRNQGFNPHRQFAFLRYTADQCVLIVANFDHAAVDVAINIPELAISMAALECGETTSECLISDRLFRFCVSDEEPLRLHLEAADAVVIPLPKKRKAAPDYGKSKK